MESITWMESITIIRMESTMETTMYYGDNYILLPFPLLLLPSFLLFLCLLSSVSGYNNGEIRVSSRFRLLHFYSYLALSSFGKFSGPFRVCKRVGETDYLVETPDMRKRHQLCHVNMLKPYHISLNPCLVLHVVWSRMEVILRVMNLVFPRAFKEWRSSRRKTVTLCLS